MKSLIILLLMTFLAGCRSVERRLVCSELKRQEFKPLELCDISFKFSRCRCRLYDLNTHNALSEAVNHPIEYCDKLSGFAVEDFAIEIGPKIKAMSRLKGNLCQ